VVEETKVRSYTHDFVTGKNFYAQNYLGVHSENRDGKLGFVFRVWAAECPDCLFGG